MKSRFLIASFIAALTASFAAVAADAPAADGAAPAAESPMAKKKVKPHNHGEANKQGAPAPEKAAAAEKPRKPLHDHMKEHKQ